MRPIQIASLIAVGLLIAGCAAHHKPRRAPAAQAAAPAVAVSVVVAESKDRSWTVEGYGLTPQDADQHALEKARDRVEEYLTSLEPAITWKPTKDYVETLVKERPAAVGKKFESGDGFECTLKLAIDPKHFREIQELDRQERVQDREMLLGKVLAGLVAVMVAVAGYFRLEEATKGYYTNLLRVAAFGLVAAVGLALLVIR
jgi:hypothetical protein